MPIKTRRRYLALKIDTAEKIEAKELLDALWSSILRLYGEYGASKAALTLISYDGEKRFAIIRASHTEVERVRAAIATITEINAKPATVHISTVSGTLRALQRKVKANF